MLINWWVEKQQRFLFNVYKRFFLFLSRFLTFFNFFLERFFTSMGQTEPGLVALYDIRPGNGAGLFLQPRSPHGA